MSTIRLVTPEDLPAEDFAAVLSALLAWKADGVERPMIPIDADVDGDGTCDAFGLDESGQLAFVSGVALAETVIESTGGGIETIGGDLDE